MLKWFSQRRPLAAAVVLLLLAVAGGAYVWRTRRPAISSLSTPPRSPSADDASVTSAAPDSAAWTMADLHPIIQPIGEADTCSRKRRVSGWYDRRMWRVAGATRRSVQYQRSR